MADLPARTEIGVTTGPIRGSRKIHVGPLGVAMRAIDLEPSCGEPPLNVYDTSGPYTDPDARIATFSGPTWILRLPRIGPVVTPISIGEGMSAMFKLLSGEREYGRAASPSLRRCQPDQVQRVGGSSLPLSRGSTAPRGMRGA